VCPMNRIAMPIRVGSSGEQNILAAFACYGMRTSNVSTSRESGTSRQPDTTAARGLRIGFTVSRALGGAVERNRMRRRLREAVRLSRPAKTPDVDLVINPKKALLTVGFESLLNEVRRAFVVIEKAALRG